MTGTRKPTVFIASAHAEKRRRWEARLRERFAVYGLTDRSALEQIVGYLRLDVLVLDLSLPGLGGIRGMRDVHALSPSTKILALAQHATDAEGVTALENGARGYYKVDIDPGQLHKAVEALERGEIWIQRRLVNALLATLAGVREHAVQAGATEEPLHGLTPRARQVGELITLGASNKEIATRLNISERTVKAHLTGMFRDLRVSDRLQLALALSGRRRGGPHRGPAAPSPGAGGESPGSRVPSFS